MKQERSTKWLIKRTLIALLVVAGLVCIVSAAAVFVLTPDTVVVEVEVTATPTSTRVATLTPRNTPTPTTTSTPTAPTEQEEILTYSSEMQLLLEEMGEASSDLSLWLNLSLLSPELRGAGTPLCVWMLEVHEKIREVDPPKILEEHHLLICKATEHYDTAMLLLIGYAETGDISKLDLSSVEMTLGNTLMGKATEELDRVAEGL